MAAPGQILPGGQVNPRYRTTGPTPSLSPAKKLAPKVVAPRGPVGPIGTPTKPGQKLSAFDQWFNKRTPGTGSAASSIWDPLAGMPQAPDLTAYPTLDASTLPDGSDVPNAPAHQFKPGQAQLVDPAQYAKLAGSASFQPIIDALTSQKNRLSSGIGDANSMIDTSFGNAANASLAGADKVRAQNAQSNQSLTDLAAKLAGIGGAENTAATGAIGGATSDQIANDKRFADIAAQTQGDQAAAAQRDAGTAKLAYKGATDKSIADLATQAASAKSQGSQAQAKAIMDALGFNSQQQTSQVSRDTAKREAWLAGQLAGPQITAQNLANSGSRQNLAINKHSAAVNDWSNLNAGKRAAYTQKWTQYLGKVQANQIQDALASGKGSQMGAELALADPKAYSSISSDLDTSLTTKAGPAVDPARMYKSARVLMRRQFPDSSAKAINQVASRYVASRIDLWSSAHPSKTGKWIQGPDGQPHHVKK